MDIVDHKLVTTEGDGVELEYRRGEPSVYPLTPRCAVIHYGVTDTLSALWRAQNYRGFFAHVSIDGWSTVDGETVRGTSKVIQALDFNERGKHAGKSAWGGHNGVSAVSFGIEISNPGPLIEKGGDLYTVYGKRWDREDAMQATHKHGKAPASWRHWAQYSDEEVDLCVQLCGLWKQHYGIVDVVGHDEIARPVGRKADPGPAFPIEYVRKAVFPELFADTERAPPP